MIKILCVGKIKEKFMQEAIKEYEKRITKYTKIKIIQKIDIITAFFLFFIRYLSPIFCPEFIIVMH